VPRGSHLGQEHFELLPFINILMCTLGCLLLIALSMASLSLSSAGETWNPTSGNGGPPKQAVLLVWDGGTVIAQIDQNRICAAWPSEDGADAEACPHDTRRGTFDQVMDYLRDHREDHYALIAVRPSGFAKFVFLRRKLTEENIDIGYEPIDQKKDVRLGTVEGQK
jgi:hypothetical protein